MTTILFPFKMNQDNKIAYAKAMDMAKQSDGQVICFTTILEESATTRDHIYLHLLELYGYYQTNYNNWKAKPKVKTKGVIKIGDFNTALQHFLASNPIVCHCSNIGH